MSGPTLFSPQPDLILRNLTDEQTNLDLHFEQQNREGEEQKTLGRSLVVQPDRHRIFNNIPQFDRSGEVTITLEDGSTHEGEWINVQSTLSVDVTEESVEHDQRVTEVFTKTETLDLNR